MKESSTWHMFSVIALLLILTFTCCSSVIVITDLDFGKIPQPARNSESDLVHVRVTSGRLGGRFFYRVSETGLPGDIPALMIPFGFFYNPSNYGVQQRNQRPLQQPQSTSRVPLHVQLQQQQQQQQQSPSPLPSHVQQQSQSPSPVPLHVQQQQHHQQQLLSFASAVHRQQQPQLPVQAAGISGRVPTAAAPALPFFPSLAPFNHQSVTQLPLSPPVAHQSVAQFSSVTPPPAVTTTTTTEKSS